MSQPTTREATFARLVEMVEEHRADWTSAGFGATVEIRGRANERIARRKAERDGLWATLSLDDLADFGEYRKAHGLA